MKRLEITEFYENRCAKGATQRPSFDIRQNGVRKVQARSLGFSSVLLLCLSIVFALVCTTRFYCNPTYIYVGNSEPLQNSSVLGTGLHPLFTTEDSTGSSANSNGSETDGNDSNVPGETDTAKDSSTQNSGTDASVEPTADSSSETATTVSPLLTAPAYYLTNIGQSTPAKLQSPWGSCWAFAITAALESSILKAEAEQAGTNAQADADTFNALDLSALPDSIDLSERAIAWFTHELQTAGTADSQAGEGLYLVDPTNPLNQLSAGNFIVAEAALVAEQCLLSESAAPYLYNDYGGDPIWFSTGSYDGASNDARFYSWALDESLRNANDTGWQVKSVLNLKSTANLTLTATGTSEYTGYNMEATSIIKKTLVEVGGVAIALEMDESLPQEVSRGQAEQAEPRDHFTYTTWAQYNAKSEVSPNHAVTIVGWNDTFSASNFAGSLSGQPPADGAWLCKNNWGSDSLFAEWDAIDEANHWGLPQNTDGSGGASGFFWLSYYDHSIMTPVAFEVERVPQDELTLYQYDYIGPAEYQKPASYIGDVQVANMFTATETQLIESVGTWTFEPDESVDVVIYTLPHSSSDISLLDGDNIDLSGYNNDFNAEDARVIFEMAEEITTQSASFETGGFHKIDLSEPVLVSKGQRFIITQVVHTKVRGTDGNMTDGSYLNLEVAFSSNAAGQPTMAQLAQNTGETYVQVAGNQWESVGQYNSWYSGMKGQAGQSSEIAFGNALIKAYGSDTTMSDSSRIYEVVPLSAVE